MADEAVVIELYGTNQEGDQRRFTVTDGTAISKGTLLKFADARLATAAAAEDEYIAGVAAMDKEANDGATSISVWTNGIFDMVASSAITAGQSVASSFVANQIKRARGTHSIASGAIIMGYALEDGDAGETINVRLRL